MSRHSHSAPYGDAWGSDVGDSSSELDQRSDATSVVMRPSPGLLSSPPMAPTSPPITNPRLDDLATVAVTSATQIVPGRSLARASSMIQQGRDELNGGHALTRFRSVRARSH